MGGYIDIKKLNLDELIGVVNLYPWFGGARKELCRRMLELGDGAWGASRYADAALYLPSRAILSDMMRGSMPHDMADADVGRLMESYIGADEKKVGITSGTSGRRPYSGVGDYFSQEQYEQVKREDDNVFSRYAAKAGRDVSAAEPAAVEFDFFTETLAQIYAEQGYYEQAKDIYSKLILAYPEKNAYFAALIQKLDELIR